MGAVIHFTTGSHGDLSPSHFLPALQTLVNRHDALRCRVLLGDQTTSHTPFVIVDNDIDTSQIVTVSSEQSKVREWIVREIRKPFELSSRVFRFSLLQRDSKTISLCLVFHHVAIDAASLHTLLLELLTLLDGGTLAPRPPQLSSVLPRAHSESPRVTETKRERIMRSWVQLLGSAKSCTQLYTSSSEKTKSCRNETRRAENDTGSGNETKRDGNGDKSSRFSECVAFVCPTSATVAVDDIAKFFNTSPTVVLTAVFVMSLHHQLQEGAYVVGCATENRRRSQRSMVGHTVNLLPLRVDVSSKNEKIDFSDVVSQVIQGWSLVMEGGVTLGDLVKILPCLKTNVSSPSNDDKLRKATPLQVLFSFLPTPQEKTAQSVSLSDGTSLQCDIEFPRSCDAQCDLFLEVRAPGNWEGHKSDTSYLFTWEYRAPLRRRITGIHNNTLFTLLAVQGNVGKRGEREGSELYLESDGFGDFENFATDESVMVRWEVPSVSVACLSQPVVWCWGSHTPSHSSLPWQHAHPVSSSRQQMSVTVGKSLPEVSLEMADSLSPIETIVKRASEVGDALAIRCNGETLTYRQMMTEIETLAEVLRGRGVAPGDHIGLLFPKSAQLYVAVLAILRCGAAYVPLSLHHPPTTLQLMLDAADVKLLLTDTLTLGEKLPHFTGAFVCVDSDRATEGHASHTLTSQGHISHSGGVEYHQHQIAYIIFTSGTTGTPKAVAITNESLSRFLANFRLVFTPRDTEVTVAGATVAWDGHVIDSLGPLTNGSCLVISPTLTVPAGTTFAFMSPSAASVVKFPETMRCVCVGGEAFTQTCYKNLENIPKIASAYGPTETTVFVSAEIIVSRDSDVEKCFSSLGRPLPGVALLVCDAQRRPVAVGTEGELIIAGAQVSRVGYYKNDSKTQESFVFVPGYGVSYRTGDWVRMKEDGNLVFLGRIDDQVKLRGMRFQLHEVESVLGGYPGIKMAAAAVRNVGTSSAQLVGFVTPGDVDIDSMFDFLWKRLPSYMVPSAITALDTLPLRTEGKVDRKKLLSLSLPESTTHTRGVATDNHVAKITEKEVSSPVQEVAEQLAGIFGKVLGLASYSVTADFFTSGGQSLLLFQLLHQVTMEMGCSLELSDLLQSFHHLSPLSLAPVVMANQTKDDVAPATPSQDRPTIGSIAESHTTSNIASSSQNKKNEVKNTLVDSEMNILTDFDYLAPVPDPVTIEFLEGLLGNHDSGRLSSDEACDQLRKVGGVSIPRSSFQRYPDIHSLLTQLKLRRLLDYLENTSTPVVRLRPPISGAEDTPLVFVHGGIIGWPLPYLSLARHLHGNSIVAIQRCDVSPTTTFEEMNAFYVDALLKVQPKGPYRLVGICYGAMMMYEIARQLTERGHTVELAVFVNHSPAVERLPRIFDSKGDPLSDTFVDPVVFFRKVLGLPLETCEGVRGGGGEGGTTTNTGAETLEERVETIVTHILSSPESCWVPFTHPELESVYMQFFLRLRCAWWNYSPRPGAAIGRCLLLRNDTHPLFVSHDFGLTSLLPAGAEVTVAVAPVRMGLMSDPATFDFVKNQILTSLSRSGPEPEN